MTTCPTCGAQNDSGNRFCDQCGTRLNVETAAAAPAAAAPVAVASGATAPDELTATAPICPSCGATALPGEAFCDNCGADLSAVTAPVAAASPEAPTVVAPVVVAAGTCPNCGAQVLPGEQFCDNCGANLTGAAQAGETNGGAGPDDATVLAEPVAPPASAGSVPIEVAPDAATVLAPPPAAPEAAPENDGAAPAAPASAEVPDAPAEPAPAAAAPAEAAPAAAASADVATYEARRAELEATIARQRQIIGQFEQMQATFGAATPAAVTAGLDEARAALARSEAELARLQPPAPAVDPAVVKGYEDEIARQRQIIGQFEQMQATFGAATPAAVTAGLDEARVALARAEAELANLGGAPAAAAPAAPEAPPVPPVPPAVPEATAAPAAEAPTTAAPAPVEAAPAPAAPAPGPRLVVADGGAVISLPADKSEFVVGREDPVSNIFPEVDLTPFGGEVGGVSRQHARISNAGGQWTVTDLNSTNYTRLDGNRLEPNAPTPLPDGAKVQFGRVVLIFHL